MTPSDWIGASFDRFARVLARSEHLGRQAARDFAAVQAEVAGTAAAARGEWTRLRSTLRASPRALRLAAAATRIAARHRLAAARAELDPERGPALFAAARERSATELRDVCAELGGGVLKIGQLLSTRGDLLPPEWIEALATLQDRAPARPFEELAPQIEADLGAPIDELFASIDPEPLATASLAQVHAGRLASGRAVAIKVQLPGAAERVRADLALVQALAPVIGAELPGGLDFAALARELSAAIAEELDFRLEAERARAFAAFAAGDERWKVPEVVASHSGRRVLCMEHCAGQSLAAHLGSASPAERDRVLGLLVELVADQILRRGLVHADPHPGNFLVDGRSGQLVILDFGCVLSLSFEERLGYARLVAAIVGHDREGLAVALEAAGFRAEGKRALADIAELLLEGLEPGALATLEPREQLERGMALLAEAGDLAVPRSFALIGRVLALVGGLLVTHRPRLDLATALERCSTGR